MLVRRNHYLALHLLAMGFQAAFADGQAGTGPHDVSSLSAQERDHDSAALAAKLGTDKSAITLERYEEYSTKQSVIRIWHFKETATRVTPGRLSALGCTALMSHAENEADGATSFLDLLDLMDSHQLLGLNALASALDGPEDYPMTLEDIIELPAKDYRDPLIKCIGEVASKASIGSGLREAVRRGVPQNALPAGRTARTDGVKREERTIHGIQGLMGQVYAANFLVNEIVKDHPLDRPRVDMEVRQPLAGTERETDIVITYGGRTISVEVKTIVKSDPDAPRDQVEKDLWLHADEGWADLCWLYPDAKKDQLDQPREVFREAMKALLQNEGFVRHLMESAAFRECDTAQEARTKATELLEQALARGLVRTFPYSESERRSLDLPLPAVR